MGEKIAVIGAGAAGTVTAAYLTDKGFHVILCDKEEHCREDFASIAERGIDVKGPGLVSGLSPKVLTHNIDEAMEASRVLVCVSGGRQKEIAEWMSPYIRSAHSLLLMPGNLGTLVFHRVFEKEGQKAGLLAELGECPWAVRRLAPGSYVSAMPLGQKRIAAFPSKDTQKALERFQDLFPLKAGSNLIEICLNSPNVITHLSGTLLNLGEIEKKGKDFALFAHGLSHGYIQCMRLLEEERKQVLEAMKMECFAAPVEPLLLKLKNPEAYPELETFRNLAGPDGLEHRFLTEDASCGTALFVSSAKKMGKEARTAEALLNLASGISGTDYYRLGRTWEWIGKDQEKIL
ncbi:MAG: NAD/NADP octopine/nopaline dehydrogenase family protein [Lachnospiraceae bacterium]|nr:NAD/NADP octopine/nopaline dehydrogenase family protein [Lachnospiraceae bacterium]